MIKLLYYYETDDAIHQYLRSLSEIYLVSILSKIGKGELEPEIHDLPEDIQVFYFPSGRIWYRNGNRFVAQTPIRFRKIAAEYKRQQVIKESKNKEI